MAVSTWLYLRLSLLLMLTAQKIHLSEAQNNFRGGTISWKPYPAGSTHKVVFNFRLAFLRSTYFCDNSTIKSRRLLGRGSWKLERSKLSSSRIKNARYRCTEFSVHEDWSAGENSFYYTFSHDGPWVVSLAGCCWFSTSYRRDKWYLLTSVNLIRRADTGRINSSPVCASFPIVRFQSGCPQDIRIPMEDPDDDIVRCRWAVGSAECGGICRGFHYATLEEASCTLRYHGYGASGLYGVALMFEDFPRGTQDVSNARPLSKVGLQFLVQIISSSGPCGRKPFFTGATPDDYACVNIAVGSYYTASLVAQHMDSCTEVVEITTVAVSGMKISSLRSYYNKNVDQKLYSRNVEWTPSSSEIGQHIFCFRALDKNGVESEQRCITLLVETKSTPRALLGTRFPKVPTVKRGPGYMEWSVHFDRLIKKPSLSKFIRIHLNNNEIYNLDTSSSGDVTISGNRTALLLRTPYPVLSMRGSYFITMDTGAVVGIGCSHDGPPTPGFSSSGDWSFTTSGVCPRGFYLGSDLYSCVDVNECHNPHARRKRSLPGDSDIESGTVLSRQRRAVECPSSMNGYYSGNFSSPNYPNNYPNNSICTWGITVPSGYRVNLEFDTFDTEYLHDILIVYDGPSGSSAEIVSLTGRLSKPRVYLSTGRSVWFLFETDSFMTKRGFHATYTATNSSVCPSSVNGNYSGRISSPNYPHSYSNKKRCTWGVTVPRGYRVKVEFDTFDTEWRYDVLRIYDGASNSSAVLVSLSGLHLSPLVYFSTGPSLWFDFSTNDFSAQKGFHATYTATKYSALNHSTWTSFTIQPSTASYFPATSATVNQECPSSLSGNYFGSFSSPNYPRNYPNNKRCTWGITVPSGFRVKVEFDILDTESGADYLRVFDGPPGSSAQLASLTGFYNSTRFAYFSSGPSLWFYFSADHSLTAKGFHATYTAFKSSVSGCPSSTSGNHSGSFSSPNYPYDYPNITTCLWRITVPSGYRVKVVFYSFKTESRQDILRIYDGPSSSSARIASLNGFLQGRRVYYSTGQSLWFNFSTDDSATRKGFYATFSTFNLSGCPSSVNGNYSGSFSSPNYPYNYLNMEKCSLRIIVPSGFRIKVVFNTFVTQEIHDYLKIFDGTSNSSALLAYLSGRRYSSSIVYFSTGPSLWFEFSSDGSSTFKGFHATYTATHLTRCPSSVSGNSSGSFSSPDYPYNYPTYKICRWGITVPRGYRVKLKFDTFQTDSYRDYLKIYDGPSIFSARLAFLSGSGYSRRLYISTGPSLWFDFSSGGSHTSKGFHATYTASNDYSACPSSESGNYSGSFSSPDYPYNYPNNKRCSWRITVPSGYRVKVEFDTFETESYHDYLKIYDGLSRSSALLASISGRRSYYNSHLVYFSTGPSLWFDFSSNRNRSPFSGFHATYTATHFPACPSSVTGNSSGSFSTPDYPSNYPKNKRCTWGITVPSGYRVKLDFGKFQTYSSDYLNIYDGPSSSRALLASLSGFRTISSRRELVYFSSGSSLWFDFSPVGISTRQGFHATYTAFDSYGCPSSMRGNYSGNFSSPNYPNNYQNYKICTWTITVPSGYRVKVEFDTFDTESTYDKLQIYDGPSVRSFERIASLSGSFHSRLIYVSTGPSLSFQFSTNGDHSEKGFHAAYTTAKIPGCPPSTSGHYSGGFTSPNYPRNYPTYKKCTWGITVPSGYRVKLEFHTFETESTYDKLQIYDGPYSSSARLASLSGSYPSRLVHFSTGPSLWFEFSSDGTITKKGFHATFTVTNSSTPKHSNWSSPSIQPSTASYFPSSSVSVKQGCPSSMNGNYSGSFSSPNYPNNYLNNQICSWGITISRGYRVKVEFDVFDMEWRRDYVRIYDGPSSSSGLLAALTGISSSRLVYFSIGPSLWFYLSTDHSLTEKGFHATYTAFKSSGCPSSASGNYSGSFSSPNYPHNYPNNKRCTWAITVPSGYRVKVEFYTFDTESNYDYLRIYDGPSSSSVQLAALNGSLSTHRFYYSTGPSLWFDFSADGDQTAKGFHAAFSAAKISGCPSSVSGNYSGSFTSPSYPNNYPNNKRCSWRITVPLGYHVKVVFRAFRTESYHDYLRIYDGPSSSSALLASISGTPYYSRRVYFSTGPSLWFNFLSDGRSTFSGFHASYTAIHLPRCPSSVSGNYSGSFSSPNYPFNYPNNKRCSWRITVPRGYRVKVVFSTFQTEYLSDYLRIYDGPSSTSVLLASRSGNMYGARVYISAGSSLWFSFITNGYLTKKGFHATYTAVKVPGCPSSVSGNYSGSFSSPNYPNNYPNNKRCSWRITVPRGYRVKVVFSTFQTEYFRDYLRIYDGPSSTSALLASRSGNMYGARVYISAGSSLWFSFITNGYLTKKGFHATYTAVKVPGCPSSVSGNYSGSFSSPNYPLNYPKNKSCSWRITVPRGYRVKVEFDTFQTYWRDYLRIYDGPSSTSALLASQSGTIYGKRVYISAGSSLWFSFTTAGYLTSKGFHATYTAVKVPGCPSSVSGNYSGSFSSPNYPFNYPNNKRCSWGITVPRGYRLKVEFDTFQTYWRDYLRIYDGPSSTSALLASQSGTIYGKRVYISAGSSLWFSFTTAGYLTSKGFHATYTAVKVPECPSSVNGNYSGSFSSPNYPYNYPNNKRCSWGITVPSGYRVEVKFDTFQTYKGDFLKIYDGPSKSSKILVILEGLLPKYSVYNSTGLSLWFEFITDDDQSKPGFHAIFTAVEVIASSIQPSPAVSASTSTAIRKPFVLHLPANCEHSCVNTPGSFNCTCYHGYEIGSPDGTCQDINECAVNNGGCSHHCMNTIGGFYCACVEGQTMSSDNHTCFEPGVSVECGQNQMQISLERKHFLSFNLNLLHLRHKHCRATGINDTHVTFVTLLNDCGTSHSKKNDKISFWNEVLADPVAIGGVVSRINKISIPFYCAYNEKDLVSAVSYTPRAIVFATEGFYGNMTFMLDLYQSASYLQPYGQKDYPVSVDVNQILYVEYKVKSNEASLDVFAEKCWATPEPSPFTSPYYTFIEDGCALDVSMGFDNFSSSSKRFTIKAFRVFQFLDGYSTVYLHCELMACHVHTVNSRCNSACPWSQRKKWAADVSREQSSRKYLLSTGPINCKENLKGKLKGKKQDVNRSEAALIGGVSVACIFAVIIIIVLIVLAIKHYRNRKMFGHKNITINADLDESYIMEKILTGEKDEELLTSSSTRLTSSQI